MAFFQAIIQGIHRSALCRLELRLNREFTFFSKRLNCVNPSRYSIKVPALTRVRFPILQCKLLGLCSGSVGKPTAIRFSVEVRHASGYQSALGRFEIYISLPGLMKIETRTPASFKLMLLTFSNHTFDGESYPTGIWSNGSCWIGDPK